MAETFNFPLLTVALRHERHVVQARQRAREVASRLGFDHQEQIRLATAASELARNAFRYAQGGTVEFWLEDSVPQMFVIAVKDAGPGIANLKEILDGRYVSKTGLGMGLTGTRRLMERFDIRSGPGGTEVECGKALPLIARRVDGARVKAISQELAAGDSADPFAEIERQNQELLKTLAALKEKQDQLTDLNRELEDTNRGVVALYAELEQHSDDLRRVSDLKTSFLSNLSHEFRTPLNSIASLCRLLLAHEDGPLAAEQEKQVGFIQRSAGDLSELVNDLLDLAKVESGRVDVKAKQFEVRDLFSGLRGMLRPLLSGNSLELMFEADDDLMPLYTDEGKVSQILRNLISNAIKFTSKGHIRVTAEEVGGGWVAFRVADTGIGISAEDRERIFEEFVQVEGELQSRVKGTGLGLPLSRRLAELLGGTLTVESVPGAGSTFIAMLPGQYGQGTPEPLDAEATAPSGGEKVLFIEDNPETRFVHQATLKNSNFEAVFAANLAQARTAMKRLKPALVVLDRLIDQKDCLYYIVELRSEGCRCPVLVVSVVDDPQGAMEAGADAFLAKPVPPFTLLNTIRELVEGGASPRVLLVDDDEVGRYLVGGALAKAGYRVLEAHGGREAMQLVRTDRPDAIVLDLTMPDMNGAEVLRELRAMETMREVPVVLHSSRGLTAEEQDLSGQPHTHVYTKQSFSGERGAEGLLQVLGAAGVRP